MSRRELSEYAAARRVDSPEECQSREGAALEIFRRELFIRKRVVWFCNRSRRGVTEL